MSGPGATADSDRERQAQEDERFDGGAPDRRVPFGKYLLLGRLARGGMAEIYRAIPAAAAGPGLLAIKCMRSHLASEGRFVEMFIREGKLAMMLGHPGIVRTFDVGSVDGRYFIAMEHINGQDLNTVLRRCQESNRRVPVPHAVAVALQVCRALHYAHTLINARGEPLNVVNRDVSPSNIRISYEGDVKLLDFGIAQALLQVSSEIGILKGKFSYMSPEQVRGLPLDRRSDVFSAGIVLHEMLACERLFRDDSEFVLMEKVRRAEVQPPSVFNRRVPAEIDRIVMRALQREPSARYPDAAEMAEDLDRALQAYRFSSTELGELVRSLFPEAYQEETALERVCLSAGSEAASTEAPAAETAPPPVRALRKRVRRRRASKRHTTLLWLAALGLLVLGLALLVVALL